MYDNKWNFGMHLIFIAIHSFPCLCYYVSGFIYVVVVGAVAVCVGVDIALSSTASLSYSLTMSSHPHLSCTIITTDGLQFFTMPVVLGNGWFPLLLANTLYCAAGLWYWYVTHLGYRALPFVQHTEVFLAPCVVLAVVYAGSLLLAATVGWNTNAARIMAKFYFV